MLTLIDRTRLFGVLAHVDAGKTTISERMLFASGRIHRVGEVHHGDTTLDHDAEERKHGITISAAASSFTWQPKGLEPHRLTLIDTPGHVDFAIEVERALRVLDGAIVVLDASRGVEPQTESVWRQAERHRVPRVVFVNKLDAPGASFEQCLVELRERLGANAVALQHVSADGRLIDLVDQLELRFDERGRMTTVPAEEPERRELLVQIVAELDGEVMQRWAADEEVPSSMLHAALRRLTCSGRLVPVVAGAALRNRGVPPVLDAVVRYLPSPRERSRDGLVADEGAAAVGFVFKTDVDPHVGSLSWTRVLQGTIRPGDAIVVRPSGRRERISRVLGLHGGQFEPLEALGPGGIAALVGLKSAKTGDTVSAESMNVVLEQLQTSEPVVQFAIEAKTNEERTKLGEALRRACLEDPSLRVRVDAETGQTVLCGVGELHLSIWLEKLARRDGLTIRASTPAVSYRDTITGEATVTYRHVRQNSGPGQFAVVTMRVAPNPSGTGFTFVDAVRGGTVAAEFVPAVERGARESLARGVREGVPTIDVQVTLLDGLQHEVDSNAMAFEVAASLAVQQACERAGLSRLEPVAVVHVSVPESHLGAALGEVSTRRGVVKGVTTTLGQSVIEARLPVARSFGFVTSLRSRTEGRGSVSMTLDGFEPVR